MTFDEGKMAIPRHFHVITMHMFTYCFLLLFFLGLEFSLNSIINKWKKLKQQYKTHHNNQRRSGTERRKKWKFFDEMDQICGHRDTSSPVCLIDSTLHSESAGKWNTFVTRINALK